MMKKLMLLTAALLAMPGTSEAIGGPSASVSPERMPAFSSVKMTVRILLPDGLQVGEQVSTQLPNSMLGKDLSYSLPKKLKAQKSGLEFGWDTVRVSVPGRENLRFSYSIEPRQFEDAVAPGKERHGLVVTGTLLNGRLLPGSEVNFVYSTMTSWTAAKKFPVRVEVNGKRITPDPTFAIDPGPTTYTRVIVPSSARPGEAIRVQIMNLDQYDNLSTSTSAGGDIKNGGQLLKKIAPFQGRTETMVSLAKAGIYRLQFDGVVSNPIRITATPQGPFWGDIHSHNAWSADAVGSDVGADHYQYARDVSALDFASLTNHHGGLEPIYWSQTQRLCSSFNADGRFVTLLGYEGGFGYHLNGYFRSCDGKAPPMQHSNAGRKNTEAFNDFLTFAKSNELLLAVHHSGINWGHTNFDGSDPFPPGLKLIEIYSAHGQSEEFSPTDALSYENAVSAPFSGSLKGPHYARDAWASGLKLFTIASSDDHNGQPGKRSNGLTAVNAARLDRSNILQGLESGNIYATTGERILLDFTMNGQPMGSVVTVPRGKSLQGQVEVHGTDKIDSVEVFRFVSGTLSTWERIFEKTGIGKSDAVFTFSTEVLGSAVYYVRVEQANTITSTVPILHQRPVRAWSSPIWVTAP